ncbi:hypothetical protein ABK040_004997 [Willaertia magna]
MSLISSCFIVDATSTQIQIKYELQNTTTYTLYVCHYYTGLESIANSGVFTVYNETKQCEMKYKGVKASRIPPTAKNYIKIEPNETISNIVLMNSSFDFQPNEIYTVTATHRLNVVDNLNNINSVIKNSITVPTISNPVTFTAI